MSVQANEKLFLLTKQLRDQYSALEGIIDSANADPNQSVERISEHMKQIKSTEEQLCPLRETFVSDQSPLAFEIKRVTDETIETVKTLMPKLASLEKASVESLRRLFPRIQGSVRAVQMQNAYRGNHAS